MILSPCFLYLRGEWDDRANESYRVFETAETALLL